MWICLIHGRRAFAFSPVLLLVAIAGCADADLSKASIAQTGVASNGPLNVVATVGMVADIVRQIGGDQVRVTQLMGAGVDPHLYKATRDDVRRIMAADLIVASGLMLEGRMESALAEIGRTRVLCVYSAGVPHDELLEDEEHAGHPDPHMWMDVAAWSRGVETIVAQLSKLRPAQTSEFQSRAAALKQQLSELHEYGVKSLASVPKSQRLLLTSHDAFRYFGRAYDVEVMGVQGLSTDSEAGLQRINELVDLLVERKVEAVFVESSVPAKSIQALIDGAASRGHDVRIGGELLSDAMGPAGTWEGTYPGMMDHNITTVTRALGGNAPAAGFAGRLITEVSSMRSGTRQSSETP